MRSLVLLSGLHVQLDLSCRLLDYTQLLVSPQVSKALHTWASFSPDLGWPCSLSSLVLGGASTTLGYSRHKPFLSVFSLHAQFIIRSSQSIYHLTTSFLLAFCCSSRVSPSPCLYVLGQRTRAMHSKGAHQLFLFAAETSAWFPRCWLAYCLTAVLISQSLLCCTGFLLPLDRALCLSHCPSPLQWLTCSRFSQGTFQVSVASACTS